MTQPRAKARLAIAAALLIVVAAGSAAMVSPARHLLATAHNTPARAALAPPLLAAGYGQDAVKTQADWTNRRAALQAVFDAEIYGAPPPAPAVSMQHETTLEAPEWAGAGRLDLHALTLQPQSGGRARLTLAVLTPDGPVRGVFLIPTECGLRALLSDARLDPPDGYRPGWCGAADGVGGPPRGMIGALFGEHMQTPPLDAILARGFAVAAWHESAIAPDSADLHGRSLAALGLDPDAPNAPGVLSLWAWTMSAVIDALETNPELADAPVFAYGHSRRGKAVLLAGARDERIDLVIAHQSGTAGAAPHADMTGEPVRSMARAYPHWFAPAYQELAAASEDALPVNQHQLLALIAPRSVHLGGANRDTWADPKGAEAAARAASPAWRLYGADPDAHISSHLRGGTHGVSDEDWQAFLEAAERAL